MHFTLDDLAFLQSDRGLLLLEHLRTEDLRDSNSLSLISRLRKAYTREQARAALELARLRQKAVDKFGDEAHSMYFTRDALEQASDPRIRRYRAMAHFNAPLIDIGCSIGSDSLAFAQAGKNVIGIDLDPVRIEMARLNAQAVGVSPHAVYQVADARTYDPPDLSVIFFDPARRDEQGNRIANVERYAPPLSLIRRWDGHNGDISVKLSPGVEIGEVQRYPGVLQFISVAGDLKEAVLYYAPFESILALHAMLITHDERFLLWRRLETPSEQSLSEPLAWLIEPDPALIRAGLVTDAAEQWNAYQLDETIAYLTADRAPDTPWARSWEILDWMPFNVKRLREYLRQHRVGTVTVKKRGTAVTPEALIPQLKLKGDNSRTIVLTRLRGEQVIIVCHDYSAPRENLNERRA